MTILNAKMLDDGRMEVSYPGNHKRVDDIERWLSYELSPGYIEWLLKTGVDPHCTNCRALDCENFGRGDDACKAFQFGEKW